MHFEFGKNARNSEISTIILISVHYLKTKYTFNSQNYTELMYQKYNFKSKNMKS